MKNGFVSRLGNKQVSCLVLVLFIVIVMCPVNVSAQSTTSSTAAAKNTAAIATKEAPGYVTLDFKDADILLVLRLLSLKSGVNIVAGPEVEGTVTIRLHDVHWEKALDVVLRTYGYVYEREGNIVRVTTRDNMAAEELLTEAFVLNYSTAKEIEDAVKEIVSDRGRIKSVERTNTVIVTDVATNIYKIGEIIKRLDKRTPQVFIDSQVIETAATDSEKVGVDWSSGLTSTMKAAGSRNITFPWKMQWEDVTQPTNLIGLQPADFGGATTAYGTLDPSATQAILNLYKSFRSTKVVSNPRIVTLSNKPARIVVGYEFPVPTYERNEGTGSMEVTGFESKDLGVVLNVTPHVNDAREILVELKPEVSSQGDQVNFGDQNVAWAFNVTMAETQVLIRDGHTIAIGGLKQDESSESINKIPFLGDLPVVGSLFRHSSKNESVVNQQKETLFFITCTIVDTENQPEYIETF